jgi:hypothetical protein
LKCFVTFKTGRGQTPVCVIADQGPMAIIVFVPER